jgi:PII-like signaling protein
VDADCIKLTSYLGGRHHASGRSAADALIDLYCQYDIAAIIVLRGMRGSGLLGDSTFGRSAELPLTAIAVGTRPNVEAVLDRALQLDVSGVFTLEHARLLSDEITPVGIADKTGEATRMTVYFGRQDSVYAVPAFEVICETLHRRGIAGATVLAGVDGIAHGRRQRAQLFGRHTDLPMMVVAVGSGDQIDLALPELGGLLRHPLITLEQVRVCKRDGQFLSRPEQAGGVDDLGFPRWQKLTVYTSEAARHDGQPIHRAIVRRLRSAGISGVTTHAGIWGYHGDRPPHGKHFPQRGHHVPAVTTVLGTAERISAAFDVIDGLTSERGLITSHTVATMRAPATVA